MFEDDINFKNLSGKQMKRLEVEKQKEERRKTREFSMKRYEATIESIKETEDINLNINNIALDLLEELGFERSASGTEYLADVIESLYHERKVFDSNNNFFDFNNQSNSHYSFANEYYECGLNYLVMCIEEEISKSYFKEQSLNDVVYEITNDIISQYDKSSKKLVYKK